jgi:hypothetical protein
VTSQSNRCLWEWHVQAILPLLNLLPAFISTILPNNHIRHKNFTLSFTSLLPSHSPQKQGPLNHINRPPCPIQVARTSPIVSASTLHSPTPVPLIPDASQGSLKRSLLTLRSLPSTKPASLPAAPTTALLVLFSRATPSLPPRSCLMRPVPIPAQLRTPRALLLTAARAMPNKPLTPQALTPILPRTQLAPMQAPPKMPLALLSTAAKVTLNKLPTLRVPILRLLRMLRAHMPTQPKILLALSKILARVSFNKPPTWLLVL